MLVALALVVAGATLSTAQAGKKDKKQKQPAVSLVSSSDSVSYAAGYVLADIVRDRFLGGLSSELKDTPDSIQLWLAYQGLFDALRGDTAIFRTQAADHLLNLHVNAARKAKEEKQKAAGEDFLKKNAQQSGVKVLPSGLQYKVLTEGTGPVAKSTDKVRVHYEGRLIDGTVFDSSYKRGESITFPLNGVIKGWTEGLQLMSIGSKYKFFIPYQLAYGERGAGASIPPYAALIFTVELLGIE